MDLFQSISQNKRRKNQYISLLLYLIKIKKQMSNFLKSLFLGKTEETDIEKKNKEKNFDIFKYDGLRAQRIGNLDYAVKCFNEALKLEEEFETMGYLASVLVQLNNLDEARDMYAKMIEKEPSLPEPLINHAQICYLQGFYKITAEDCIEAIHLDENNAATYLLLAKANWGLEEKPNAIAHLTKAIELKKDFYEAYLTRAEYLEKLNEFTCAMEDIEEVLMLSPNNEAALLLRGKMHEINQEPDKAIEDYEKVIELNPFNEQTYLYLGQLFISEKRLEEAITDFDEAIELSPNFVKAYQERGRAKFLNGDKEGSLADMKKSLEIDPEEAKKLDGEFKNFSDLYSNRPL